jgi:hypothetical protein
MPKRNNKVPKGNCVVQSGTGLKTIKKRFRQSSIKRDNERKMAFFHLQIKQASLSPASRNKRLAEWVTNLIHNLVK